MRRLAEKALFVSFVSFFAPSMLGCINFGTKSPHEPGEALGIYLVDATRSSTTCGQEVPGMSARLTFKVKLSRDRTTLFWYNSAEVISGVIDDDTDDADDTDEKMSCSFDTTVVKNMRKEPQSRRLFSCSIARHDHFEGVLVGKGNDVPSFTGTLSYEFEPTAGSRCEDLVAGKEDRVPGSEDRVPGSEDRVPGSEDRVAGEEVSQPSTPMFAALPCSIVYLTEGKREVWDNVTP